MTNGSNDYVQHVLTHYKDEAKQHGTSAASTMWDETTRSRELDAIVRLVRHVGGANTGALKLLEVGAGNGVLLDHLSRVEPALRPIGLEFSPEMFALAQGRNLPGATVLQGDVRSMPFETACMDVVVSERCVINLMDRAHQRQAFAEIARVLRPGGHYICVEAFTDGHENLNRARAELGLAAIPQAHHNLWLEPSFFRAAIEAFFQLVELQDSPELPSSNFLSSHYFVSRVLYPAITKSDVRYNTSFVQFFGFLPPSGNFSPIQVFLLRRRDG